MKLDSMFHVLVLLITALIFSMPFATLAQQDAIEAEAAAQAIADAENDTNKSKWFATGCFLNILGVIIAQSATAPIPAERLVGKPTTYVNAYISSYQEKREKIQAQAAALGCVAGTMGCIAILASNSGGGGSRGGGSGGGYSGGSWCSPFSF